MGRPESWSQITSRTKNRISRWVTLMAREVEFAPSAESQTYHSVETFDYVVVLAMSPDGPITPRTCRAMLSQPGIEPSSGAVSCRSPALHSYTMGSTASASMCHVGYCSLTLGLPPARRGAVKLPDTRTEMWRSLGETRQSVERH